jgi:hypothetical protein
MSFTSQSKIQSNIECEQRVLDLLEALEKDQESFSNNLKSFEEYYLSQKPMLSSNYIKRLLFVCNLSDLWKYDRVMDIK